MRSGPCPGRSSGAGGGGMAACPVWSGLQPFYLAQGGRPACLQNMAFRDHKEQGVGGGHPVCCQAWPVQAAPWLPWGQPRREDAFFAWCSGQSCLLPGPMWGVLLPQGSEFLQNSPESSQPSAFYERTCFGLCHLQVRGRRDAPQLVFCRPSACRTLC